jgi:hypothetical protein
VFRGGETVLDLADNWVTRDNPGFVDFDAANFALREDAAIFQHVPDFEPIPFAEIGLRKDDYRRSLPLQAPRVVPDGLTFADPIRVRIHSKSVDAEIRYTRDGTAPTRESTLYAGPFELTEDASVRAAAFRPDDPAALPALSAVARFVRIEFGEGKGVFLSDLVPEEEFSHGGLKRDVNYLGNDFITLSGQACRKGLLLHPEKRPGGESAAYVVYVLEGALEKATRFRARVGIDDGADHRGSVSFRVEVKRGDRWTELVQTPILRGGSAAEQRDLDLDISGATHLRLSARGGTDISADHAAWGMARIE